MLTGQERVNSVGLGQTLNIPNKVLSLGMALDWLLGDDF